MPAYAAAQLREAVLVKLHARQPDISNDLSNECIDRAEEYFRAKTGRQNIPPGAMYLWIDMAERFVKLQSSNQSASTGVVTSVKRGDTTISYSDEQVAEAMCSISDRIALYRVVRAR